MPAQSKDRARTKLEAYLAIPMPFIEAFEGADCENQSSRVLLYDALDDLVASSGQLDFDFGAGICQPEIAMLDDAARRAVGERGIVPIDQPERCEVLLISTSVPLAVYDDIKLLESTPVDRRAVARALAQINFCKRVSDLLVMENLGRVGSIELPKNAVVQDGEVLDFSEIPAMNSFALQRAVKVARQMGWPKIQVLDTKTVWAWAIAHRAMLDGFEGSAMGRALNAFTRVFEQTTEDQPMQLLWALVGLEALYVTGKADLLQQVREKSQVLLGRQDGYKNRISRMYDFRSRFVHGDLDFPGLCHVEDARDVVARYDDELWEAIDVAVAVLAASIQEVISRNWSGLKFEYSVSDASAVPK